MEELKKGLKCIKLYLVENPKEINSNLFTEKGVDIAVLEQASKSLFYFQSENTAGIIGHLLKWKLCNAPSPDLQCLASENKLSTSINALLHIPIEIQMVK